MTIRPLTLVLLLLLSAACGGSDSAAPDASAGITPASDPTLAPAPTAVPTAATSPATPVPASPTAVLPDGTAVQLELAVSPEEHAQGLMFRPSLQVDRGMLFLFEQSSIPVFWMKDTWVALDLVFLDEAGRVVDVVRDAQPCREEPCPQYRPHRAAAAVLEVAAGTAAAHEVATGARLTFHGVPGFPVEAADRS